MKKHTLKLDENHELIIKPLNVKEVTRLTGKNEVQTMEEVINIYLERNNVPYRASITGDMRATKVMEKYGDLLEKINEVNGF